MSDGGWAGVARTVKGKLVGRLRPVLILARTAKTSRSWYFREFTRIWTFSDCSFNECRWAIFAESWGATVGKSQCDQFAWSYFRCVHNATTVGGSILLRFRSHCLYFGTHAGQSQHRCSGSIFELCFLDIYGLFFLSRSYSLKSCCRFRVDY